MVPQDLHIHSRYSTGDSSVVEQQTIALIAAVKHARSIGISDHFDYVCDEAVFHTYKNEIRSHGLKVGVEVDGSRWVERASVVDCDYYVYHCRDSGEEYRGLETLVETGKPVITAHPFILGTDLKKVPPESFIEINNRYIWRCDWRTLLPPLVSHRRFVISSDAHQPNWLNQNVARYVCREVGIEETILF